MLKLILTAVLILTATSTLAKDDMTADAFAMGMVLKATGECDVDTTPSFDVFLQVAESFMKAESKQGGEALFKANIKGSDTFDLNMKRHGREKACAATLKQFPEFLVKSKWPDE
ncbi:hypothetical protein [Neorhizobium galegae]|uniref:hypothetical protein n=1 Tax=Neorhizobium galegae TaxID=399 RepID=UPI000621AD5E|nr:hypothetical protein [Neorhizobium galegae]KAB1126316.1 hypothetical protein F4V90_04160 [Neorhizobium galegae]MCQ1805287.1 hypothetical protein [Neorhizobium galegae]CDZ56049.1 Hypothetical protein NGAL_HAMBI2566_05990 [Neorhizobium galegae bv. orientalis]